MDVDIKGIPVISSKIVQFSELLNRQSVQALSKLNVNSVQFFHSILSPTARSHILGMLSADRGLWLLPYQHYFPTKY